MSSHAMSVSPTVRPSESIVTVAQFSASAKPSVVPSAANYVYVPSKAVFLSASAPNVHVTVSSSPSVK